MLKFILNNNEINSSLPSGLTLLDFIRYQQNLTGTKIGCREGDCGACTVLVGELKNGKLIYTSATCCLMALGNTHGKHIVTVEGINVEGLNTVQEAFAKEGATQCGFCTPGFIVSLTGFCISDKVPSYDRAIDSVNGNICRCTGYKSIERAADIINKKMTQRAMDNSLEFAVANNFIPSYFLTIQNRLGQILKRQPVKEKQIAFKRLAGGTDLYVQQHDKMTEEPIEFLFDDYKLNGISSNGYSCEMGASTTVSDISESIIFQDHFPNLQKYIKLVSSTQIRNMATVAGNFTNASPIGDLTIFFLALDANLGLNDGVQSRILPLRQFYNGYKLLNKTQDEIIEKIIFDLPEEGDLFHFEKVCKRTYLDIASVNSAIFLKMREGQIVKARISAGGVGPIPTYLSLSSDFLAGKRISAELIRDLIQIVKTEISPISDARGTELYKRLLLTQLIKAHFLELFPALPLEKIIELT